MVQDTNPDRIHWLKSAPFFLVHAMALATPLLAPLTWEWALLAAASYGVRMFVITAGYHRYFSHRAYRTGRPFQAILALLGATATQKGPLWWAAHHRDHHRYSDGPQDIHSPVQKGFLWSHVGWILAYRHERSKLENVRDLARYPELRWLDRWHLVPPIAFALALALAGGWGALLWGYFVSTVLLWHGSFLVNSVAHVLGRRRYSTNDDSRNSFALALITFGEGWHNNHHFYPGAACQGFYWWEIDVSYYVLRTLALLGLVWDLRTPPRHVREGGRLAPTGEPFPRLGSGTSWQPDSRSGTLAP